SRHVQAAVRPADTGGERAATQGQLRPHLRRSAQEGPRVGKRTRQHGNTVSAMSDHRRSSGNTNQQGHRRLNMAIHPGIRKAAPVLALAVAVGLTLQVRAQSDLQTTVNSAFTKYQSLQEGKNADYIPALAKVDPNLFGIALVTADGKVFTAGDVKTEVSIQ